MALICSTLLFLIMEMFGCTFNQFKIKKKIYLFPCGALLISLVIVYFCYFINNKKNSPAEQIFKASMEYQLCMLKSAPGSCDSYNDTLKIKKITAEMLQVDQEKIDQSINKGRIKATQEQN